MNKSPEVFILCLLLVQSWLVLPVAWEVPPPLLFVLLIASMVTLYNFRWCENSRMQWVVGVSSWSGRMNGDEKLVISSQQGHGGGPVLSVSDSGGNWLCSISRNTQHWGTACLRAVVWVAQHLAPLFPRLRRKTLFELRLPDLHLLPVVFSPSGSHVIKIPSPSPVTLEDLQFLQSISLLFSKTSPFIQVI